ncbi:MAG: choice-of-anchor D domain-containing protein, partial [Marinobacter sp.]
APVYDVECPTADTCNFSLNATYDGQPVTLQVRKYLGLNYVNVGNGSYGLDPEIDILGRGRSIADGDTSPTTSDYTDFEDVVVDGVPLARTYTIRNTGFADLSLTNVTSDNAFFVVSGTTSGTVAVSDSVTFTVTYTPEARGTHDATITVTSDDDDEGTYTFDIAGRGITPEIDIEGNGITILDGDTSPSTLDGTDFGGVLVAGGSNANTFTMRNTGPDRMTVNSVSSSDPTQFSVSGVVGGTLISGGANSFTVHFNPASAGTHNAVITVQSIDADEGTYTFSITGEGTEPESNIQGNGVSIVNGDNSPDSADDTDFGSVAVAGGSNPNTFTIQN